MDEEINDQTYRRMMLQVDRTMFSDILFLKDNICNNDIKITSEEEENLLATGWLIFAGIGWEQLLRKVAIYIDIREQQNNSAT